MSADTLKNMQHIKASYTSSVLKLNLLCIWSFFPQNLLIFLCIQFICTVTQHLFAFFFFFCEPFPTSLTDLDIVATVGCLRTGKGLEAKNPEDTQPHDAGSAMTALSLTCLSADSETSSHECFFPSVPGSPLTPFRNWFVWVTSENLHRHLGKGFLQRHLFSSLFILTTFHTSVRRAWWKDSRTSEYIWVFKRIH